MDKVDRNTGVRFERLRFGEAIIGALPFLVFGIVFAADQIELPFPSRYLYLAFYLLVLVGLGAGLVMSFPLWAYSYLGWTLMITLDGMMHWGPGGSCLEAITGGSWQSWVPFGIVVLVGLLWARSLEPLKNVFTGIWKDWTHLSLVLFAAGGWMASGMYDENHHPYLVAFMLGSTLAISVGVWVFLRGKRAWVRGLALLLGLFCAFRINGISMATWDWRAYYGLPESTATWYENLRVAILPLTFWALFLLWPVLIELLRSLIRKNRTGKPTAA